MLDPFEGAEVAVSTLAEYTCSRDVCLRLLSDVSLARFETLCETHECNLLSIEPHLALMRTHDLLLVNDAEHSLRSKESRHWMIEEQLRDHVFADPVLSSHLVGGDALFWRHGADYAAAIKTIDELELALADLVRFESVQVVVCEPTKLLACSTFPLGSGQAHSSPTSIS